MAMAMATGEARTRGKALHVLMYTCLCAVAMGMQHTRYDVPAELTNNGVKADVMTPSEAKKHDAKAEAMEKKDARAKFFRNPATGKPISTKCCCAHKWADQYYCQLLRTGEGENPPCHNVCRDHDWRGLSHPLGKPEHPSVPVEPAHFCTDFDVEAATFALCQNTDLYDLHATVSQTAALVKGMDAKIKKTNEKIANVTQRSNMLRGDLVKEQARAAEELKPLQVKAAKAQKKVDKRSKWIEKAERWRANLGKRVDADKTNWDAAKDQADRKQDQLKHLREMEDGNTKIAEQAGKNKLKGQQEDALAKVAEIKKKEKLVSGAEERTKQAEADASKKFYADRAKRQIAQNKLTRMNTKQEKDQGVVANADNAQREMTERMQKVENQINQDQKDAIKDLRAEQGHIEVVKPHMRAGVEAYEKEARAEMRNKHLTWRANSKSESWIHARATDKLEEEGFKKLTNPDNEKSTRKPLDKAEQDQWLEKNKQLFATDGLSHIKDMQNRGYTLPNATQTAPSTV